MGIITKAMSGDKTAVMELIPIAADQLRPVVEAKKAEYLQKLTETEIDISFTLRSKNDIYFYAVNAINADETTGRLLDSGVINSTNILNE